MAQFNQRSIWLSLMAAGHKATFAVHWLLMLTVRLTEGPILYDFVSIFLLGVVGKSTVLFILMPNQQSGSIFGWTANWMYCKKRWEETQIKKKNNGEIDNNEEIKCKQILQYIHRKEEKRNVRLVCAGEILVFSMISNEWGRTCCVWERFVVSETLKQWMYAS